MSPLPQKKGTKEKLVGFNYAIEQAVKGKKVTRKEWADNETYGFIKDKVLCIHIKNKDNAWIISELDISAKDWMVL